MAGKPPAAIADRFWAKVDRRGPDECWPFLGARDKKGYGRFRTGSKRDGSAENTPAHRVAWAIAFGAIPEDKPHVLHRCDNPPCQNPAHLFVGTNADNVADMDAKGRRRNPDPRPGESNHAAKLNEHQVREIRARFAAGGITKTKLADEYGVSAFAVYAIVKGLKWRHVA